MDNLYDEPPQSLNVGSIIVHTTDIFLARRIADLIHDDPFMNREAFGIATIDGRAIRWENLKALNA